VAVEGRKAPKGEGVMRNCINSRKKKKGQYGNPKHL
jgi:hypothetical protein